ncbi:hypothetical protein E2562_019218 [Oryza meyeriana var. granulata]|uniref:Uncharacterized protein n=1 Tax=Oryza meyeriana var. granulata TaxID=110450 RepID=A0A6G1FA88_9ORYZ|nr:hypothetical protein E2562_019218 [Oryza meyeriana var. granulata]
MPGGEEGYQSLPTPLPQAAATTVASKGGDDYGLLRLHPDAHSSSPLSCTGTTKLEWQAPCPSQSDPPILISLLILLPTLAISPTTSSKRFCRLVADARFRSLVDGRAPVVLGHYYTLDRLVNYLRPPAGDPPFVPSSYSSSSTDGSDDGRRCFSIDYHPFDRPRELVDSRRSLLLFDHDPWRTTWHDHHYPPFPDLLVCEPLTRRFQGIACIPASLVGSVRFRSTYLIDGSKSGGISMSNYRVVCMAAELAFVFSPGSDGGWSSILNDDHLLFPRDSDFAERRRENLLDECISSTRPRPPSP